MKRNEKDEFLLLVKLGRAKNPKIRAKGLNRNNAETYSILVSFYSQFHMHLEWLIHKYFRRSRVVRPSIEDGKTEWFLVGCTNVICGIRSVR